MVDKAQKAVYEAERKQLVQSYQKKIKALEQNYSTEVEEIQDAFFSLARNYEAKTLEAGAKDQMIEEMQMVSNQAM